MWSSIAFYKKKEKRAIFFLTRLSRSNKNKKATKKQDRFPTSTIQHSIGLVNTFLYKTYFYALGNL